MESHAVFLPNQATSGMHSLAIVVVDVVRWYIDVVAIVIAVDGRDECHDVVALLEVHSSDSSVELEVDKTMMIYLALKIVGNC